jgi:hypothetical protein
MSFIGLLGGCSVKTILFILILFATLGQAQESGGNAERKPTQPGATPEKPGKVVVRRLESVSWNPVRAELTWVLSVWDADISKDKPAGQEHYVIHVDEAVMEHEGETRGFDTDEARRVRSLMDMISRYAVESTVRWGRGEASRGEGQVTPSPKDPNLPKPKETPDGGQSPKPTTNGTPIALRQE